MIEKRGRISGLILLLLFIFNYVGSNFFPHTHTIDGVDIVHSHPYSSDGHNHSRAVINFLSQTTFTLTTTIVTPLLIFIFFGIIGSFVKKYREEYNTVISTSRAPPVLNY